MKAITTNRLSSADHAMYKAKHSSAAIRFSAIGRRTTRFVHRRAIRLTKRTFYQQPRFRRRICADHHDGRPHVGACAITEGGENRKSGYSADCLPKKLVFDHRCAYAIVATHRAVLVINHAAINNALPRCSPVSAAEPHPAAHPEKESKVQGRFRANLFFGWLVLLNAHPPDVRVMQNGPQGENSPMPRAVEMNARVTNATSPIISIPRSA